LGIYGGRDGRVVRRHLPVGAVEDLEPSAELFVMLTVIMPLTADVSSDRECRCDFFATEAPDQAQMLRVSFEDVRLTVKRRLKSVG